MKKVIHHVTSIYFNLTRLSMSMTKPYICHELSKGYAKKPITFSNV